ncbi:AAA family ATPase [Nonomuraea sp. NPDC050663]|uniref:AAA family ATPase n=1 Tax=Nonomuraea sp. NPDC050663 TaxID=3364370 RepID=UPI0037B38BA7
MPRRNDVSEWRVLPHQVLILLDSWLDRDGSDLILKGWFPAGRGRDPVGLVERSRNGEQCNLVAKFYRPPVQLKVAKVTGARASSPMFPHLALPQGDPVSLGEWTLVLHDVARGDLGTVRPLQEPVVRGDPKAGGYCSDIVGSIVRDWNCGSGTDAPQWSSMTVAHFMRTILGDRIGPGGPIQEWAARADVPVSGRPDSLALPGWSWSLPNPFSLLNNRAHRRLSADSVVTGRAHGDLSGRNILLPMSPRPRPEEYVLIDLDRFDTAAPLARDPMHLLVALAMDLLADKDLDATARRDLVNVIVDPQASSANDIVERFGRISAAVHEAPVPWAQRSGHGQEWRTQSTLALVAAALMHVGRSFFSEQDRAWCFDLAAVATEHYQDLTSRDDTFAPRRQAAPAPLSPPPDPDEPMDTLRLVVLHAPDGQAFLATMTDRLRSLPVGVCGLPSGPDDAGELARADAVAVVLTAGFTLSQSLLRALEEAARPILWLRVHRTANPPKPPLADAHFDFVIGGDSQWEEMLGHLRWIGSPSYLIDLYGKRLSALDERHSTLADWALARNEQACMLLEERRAAQQTRRARQSALSATAVASGTAGTRESADGGLRCYGRPAPQDNPLDRLNETDQLVTLLERGNTPVALTGPEGFGKTAMVSRLLHRIRKDRSILPIDGFVYLPARGPHLIDAATVLGAITEVSPDRGQAERVRAEVMNSAVLWTRKVDRVLEALAGTRVLLVLDDVQDLVNSAGELDDRQLLSALTMALQQSDGRLRLLMVSTREVVEPLPAPVSLRLDLGLDQDAAWQLLCGMDPDHVLNLAAHEELKSDLTRLTKGNPRVLELVAALLHGDVRLTLPDLVEQLKRERSTWSWANRVLVGLDRTEQRVLQALATLGMPVEAKTVDAVLAPFLPGQINGPVLDELARRRLIRRDGRHYTLPRDPDGGCELGRVDCDLPGAGTDSVPLTRHALSSLAADHFAACAPVVHDEQDMRLRLTEVEMRLAGGEWDQALEAMYLLDESHREGRTPSPCPAHLRDRIPPRDTYLGAHNLASRAESRLHEDDASTAITDLEQALEICLLPKNAFRDTACRVAIQLGGAQFHDGNTAKASERYEFVLENREADWHLLRGQAHAGRMRCLYEWGKFADAMREYGLAQQAYDRSDDPDKPYFVVSLQLDLGMLHAACGDWAQARQVLRRGEQEARRLSQPHLEGSFIGQRAMVCLDSGEPDKAVELASRAQEFGAQTNNIPLIREAATWLAQAHLARGVDQDFLRAAQKAAEHAVYYSKSNKAGTAFAVYGITLLLLDRIADARIAFHDAFTRAKELCDLDPANFESRQLLGLASCGLGVCGDAQRFREAEEAFTAARHITGERVILLRTMRLLGRLIPEPTDRTRPVVDAVSGVPDSYP